MNDQTVTEESSEKGLSFSDIKQIFEEVEETLSGSSDQNGIAIYNTKRWVSSAAVMNLVGAMAEDREPDYALDLCTAALEWVSLGDLYNALPEAVAMIISSSASGQNGTYRQAISELEKGFLSQKAQRKLESKAQDRIEQLADIEPIDLERRAKAAMSGLVHEDNETTAQAMCWLLEKLQNYTVTLSDAIVRYTTNLFQRDLKLADIGLLDHKTISEKYEKAVNANRDGLQKALPELMLLADYHEEERATNAAEKYRKSIDDTALV